MKKIFIAAMLLVSIPVISQADVYGCPDADGRIYYGTEKRHKNCVAVIKTSEAEKRAIKKAQEQEYRERVRATAKFLDDVEAFRKK
jgi:hypothetical protein